MLPARRGLRSAGPATDAPPTLTDVKGGGGSAAVKNVCCPTGSLTLSAKLIYFIHLQRAPPPLRFILCLPEPTAKIQATHPNAYKIITSSSPGTCPRDREWGDRLESVVA